MRRLALVLFLICLVTTANAANRFWVGGTGTLDSSDTTHWSATSGGAGGASVPGIGDAVIFDASSGGGTVTVNFGGAISILSLAMGAFTGTLDFSVNNNSIITGSPNGTGINISGTGTRTLKMGNGTWTTNIIFAGASAWNASITTNLTFQPNGSTIVINGTTTNQTSFAGGGLAYNNITIGPNTSLGYFSVANSGGSFANITLSPPASLVTSTDITATSLTSNGTSSNQNYITTTTHTNIANIISIASGSYTLNWTGIRATTFSGGATFAATNSFNLGLNSGISFGGGGCILGGWLLWRDFHENLNDNFPVFLEKAA